MLSGGALSDESGGKRSSFFYSFVRLVSHACLPLLTATRLVGLEQGHTLGLCTYSPPIIFRTKDLLSDHFLFILSMALLRKCFYITESYFRDFHGGSDSQLDTLVSKWCKQGGIVGAKDQHQRPYQY